MSVVEITETEVLAADSARSKMDPALLALVRAARRFDLAVEPGQLTHQLGLSEGLVDSLELCRCARWIGLRARCISTQLERLQTLPLPALYRLS